MKVTNELQIYEINGEPVRVSDKEPTLFVLSNWNRRAFVDLKIGQKTITVCASALQKAIANAINVDY